VNIFYLLASKQTLNPATGYLDETEFPASQYSSDRIIGNLCVNPLSKHLSC